PITLPTNRIPLTTIEVDEKQIFDEKTQCIDIIENLNDVKSNQYLNEDQKENILLAQLCNQNDQSESKCDHNQVIKIVCFTISFFNWTIKNPNTNVFYECKKQDLLNSTNIHTD